jgi:hypothetical protein
MKRTAISIFRGNCFQEAGNHEKFQGIIKRIKRFLKELAGIYLVIAHFPQPDQYFGKEIVMAGRFFIRTAQVDGKLENEFASL